MTVIKHPIMPDRLRRVPPGFGWVDHRFVRERHVQGVSCPALALYLFLVTVADGDGLSHWGEQSLARVMNVTLAELKNARCELESHDLVAYEAPLWQVLSLPKGGGK